MDYKQLLIDSGIKMLSSGLTVATWGNISIRDPETEMIYITPTSMPYDIITKEDIVTVDEEGNVIEGFRKPSIETVMHCSILKNRKDINAIVHTHPIYSKVFAVLHEDIPLVMDEAVQTLKYPVRVTDYRLPGTVELAEEVTEKLGKGFACLIANHGAVCIGSDIDEAFKVSLVLENTARIYYMSRCIAEPIPLT